MTNITALGIIALILGFTVPAYTQTVVDTRLAQAVSPTTTTDELTRLSVASPPKFKVGDTWTYQQGARENTWTVKEVSGSLITIQRDGRLYQYSPEGNLVQGYSQSGRPVNFTPSTREIKFPLQEGSAWDETYSGLGTVTGRKRGDDRAKTWQFRAKGVVEGLEEVKVPAGTFKAWKIRLRVESVDGENSTVIQTCWYAEDVKRVVKCAFETQPERDFVLAKYTVQK